MDDRSDFGPSLTDTIDLAGRRIMTGLIVAGIAIGLALYSQPDPPRYETDVVGSTVLRTNIRSGTVLACEGQRCYVVVERGQGLEDGPLEATQPPPRAPAPEARKALPAPAAEPAPAPANGQ